MAIPDTICLRLASDPFPCPRIQSIPDLQRLKEVAIRDPESLDQEEVPTICNACEYKVEYRELNRCKKSWATKFLEKRGMDMDWGLVSIILRWHLERTH
jgi:hypothetical protein